MIKAEYLFLINSFILRERERERENASREGAEREERARERENPKLALPC